MSFLEGIQIECVHVHVVWCVYCHSSVWHLMCVCGVCASCALASIHNLEGVILCKWYAAVNSFDQELCNIVMWFAVKSFTI